MSGNVLFIGAGNMAEAIVGGIISAKKLSANKIIVTDIDNKKTAVFQKKYKVKTTTTPSSVLDSCSTIFLCVKPQHIKSLLQKHKNSFKKKHLIISIAAGITIKSINKYATSSPIIRIMPNTPCLVKEGMSAICHNKKTSLQQLRFVESIFDSIGKTVIVNEKSIDAITAISGSGPAFIASYINAMLKAAKKQGLNRQTSKELVNQTILGTLKLLDEKNYTPEELIKKVASPKGTTEAGLKILRKKKFQDIIGATISAATKRSKDLAQIAEK